MKKKRDKIFFWICIIICILCVGYIGYYYIQKAESKKEFKEVKKKVVKEEKPTEEEEKDEIPIDFAELKKVNDEIYAWVQVPDTNIDYPILQSETDDAFYLNHAFDKKYDVFGAVFTEKINKKDFTDFNTVVYGHNIKDGSFFQNLHKFEEEEFFNSHDTFTIYTETEKKTYKIFAAVEYSNKHILYNYDNQNPEEQKAFLQSLKESRSMKNHYRDDVTVDENSKIVTLSTCIRGEPKKRYIVVGVK